jgi:hypothetical protein
LFCEAVKVDDSLSDADLKKNDRNTISLLTVLFEDPSEAQNWYDNISKKLCGSDGQIAEMSSLFNNTNESDDLDKFRVGQDIFDKLPGWKQEVAKLWKSWCLFADSEWFGNLLVIVGEVIELIYGSKTDIPDNFLEVFYLDHEKVHAHMNRWKSSDISGHGYSHSALAAGKKITVQPESSRPKQFKLEKLVSMTTITSTVGKGWDTLEASNYFSADNDDTIDPKETLMTTLHSFEEANILYSTMKQIKVTTNEKMKRSFLLNVSWQIMTKKIKQFESSTVNCSKMKIIHFVLEMIW